MIPGMEHGMEQAVATFVNESKELLEEMENGLLQIEEQGECSDSELIHAIFRAIHTIKGSAGIFGFEHVVDLTHISETILDQIRNGETKFDKELLKLFLNCRDLTEALVIDASEEKSPGDSLLATVESLIEQLKIYQINASSSECTSGGENFVLFESQTSSESTVQKAESCLPKATNNQWHISFRPGPGVFQCGLDPFSCIRYLAKLGSIKHIEVVQDLLVEAAEFDPELCYLGFEIAFVGDMAGQQIMDVFEFIQSESDIVIIPPASEIQEYISLLESYPNEKKKLGELLVRNGAISHQELEAALDLQNELKEKQAHFSYLDSALTAKESAQPEVTQVTIKEQTSKSRNKTQQAKTLRVEAQKLDTLLDQVGEMVITGARTNLLARETGNEDLIEAMSLLARLVENIRDSSLKLRMVQIEGTFSKFKRVVRDIAEDMGKKVRLEIKGEETELDKTVIEKIGDPLMHIVRNAIDHGIEIPEERLNKGKSEFGRILLNSYHDSGSIVIEVSDDGKGIDKAKVRQRAIERGVISSEVDLNDKDIYELMFEPGFSTAEQVTSISGRGVGLDVVKRNIDSLRGTVEIESKPDHGSTMRIRLPLTLSIIDGLVFEVASSTYVIPLETVEECMGLHEVVPAYQSQEKQYVNFRGEMLPLIRLRTLFEIKERSASGLETLVIIHFGSLRAGIVVDSLKGEFQTVVKPLGDVFREAKCFSGATILGSGDVAMILDVPALIKVATVKCNRGSEAVETDMADKEMTDALAVGV